MNTPPTDSFALDRISSKTHRQPAVCTRPLLAWAWNLLSVGLIMMLADAAPASDPIQPVDYLSQVKPLLAAKCYPCHGILKQEAELRLETRDLLLSGGDSGPALVPGHPEQSLLIARVAGGEDERMPPADEGAALKPDEVDLLRRWIREGAEAPREETPVGPEQHWAFQRIEKPTLPNGSPRSTHPVDAFLSAKQAERDIQPLAAAPRSLRLRRLYLDLIGLPPTLQQLADDRPWTEIVDELLASPQYGERWGRHWMDVWRYSDWYGLGAQLRNSQKHLWHWRDWIIESLNEDKGYDQMILEMLAGDELAPADPDTYRATGFLARNYYLFNRTTWLDSTIEHTSKAFLGLTLNCAKCHDHKYDPISQLDYYRLRAIFEPHQVRLDPVPGETDLEKNGIPRVFDDQIEISTYVHVRGDPQNPDTSQTVAPGVPELFASFAPSAEPISLPPYAYAPGSRKYVQDAYLAQRQAELERARQQLTAAQRELAEANERLASPQLKDYKLDEPFDELDPERWEVVGSGWKFENGAAWQTQASRDESYLRLKSPLPRDFELICQYTTTGGTTYKSVTFRFDESKDRKYANFVYTSAHEPGPKVQVAYTREGTTQYPPEGRIARPIQVGKSYALKFAVRDRLVNVWLDDKFILAYLLPDRREGQLTLSGFDATVRFESLMLRSLPLDYALVDAGTGGGNAASSLELAVQVAEKKLNLSQASLASLQAAIAADRIKYQIPTDENALAQAAFQAAELELTRLMAVADHDKLANAADPQKVKAAEQQFAEAQQQLAKLRDRPKSAEIEYPTLRASRKALETPEHKESDYPAVYARESTGRRLAFARWMVARDHPLTARVAVNHIWTRHFGQSLVDSMFDFGLRTPQPLQHELLDFLAMELIESGWSLKHLHRLIVTSQTYQLCSSATNVPDTSRREDPENQTYWRMPVRRMESQVVRDSLLSLAGQLDLQRGGPSVNPGPTSRRRSIYFKHSRDDQDLFLSMFDDADLLQCYRRSESIVPQQALALANSRLSLDMSAEIARRIDPHTQLTRADFIAQSFQSILARPATPTEQEACGDFMDELETLLNSETRNVAATRVQATIRKRLVHALLNHNDFVTIR